MFLNLNSFKKHPVLFNDGDDFFGIDGRRILFMDVAACYVKETVHFTNGVYHGHSLRLVLAFSGGLTSEICEVDSKHHEDYALLHRLAAAVLTWRRQQLEERFRDGLEVEFPLLDAGSSLRINKDGIFVGNERVQTIDLNNNGQHPAVEFGLERRKAILPPGDISDRETFVGLASSMLPIGKVPPSTVNCYLRTTFYGAVILFGLNGWFGSYTANRLVELVSLVSGIILGVWVVTWPFFVLVGRLNSKKMLRHLHPSDGARSQRR